MMFWFCKKVCLTENKVLCFAHSLVFRNSLQIYPQTILLLAGNNPSLAIWGKVTLDSNGPLNPIVHSSSLKFLVNGSFTSAGIWQHHNYFEAVKPTFSKCWKAQHCMFRWGPKNFNFNFNLLWSLPLWSSGKLLTFWKYSSKSQAKCRRVCTKLTPLSL